MSGDTPLPLPLVEILTLPHHFTQSVSHGGWEDSLRKALATHGNTPGSELHGGILVTSALRILIRSLTLFICVCIRQKSYFELK